MMKQLIQITAVKLFILSATLQGFTQQNEDFTKAYDAFPELPKGILEAVAYCNTHMQHLTDDESTSCLQLPRAYGIMGVFENGQAYFRENGKLIAKLSGIGVEEQKQSIEKQIFAYACCFQRLLEQENFKNEYASSDERIFAVLRQMSEIPEEGLVNAFALDAQIFQYLSFMNSLSKAEAYGFPVHHFDLAQLFGADNYKVLSAKRIELDAEGIHAANISYRPIGSTKSNEFGPAIWNPAATCNFSSRNGTAIAAVTIHTIQGTYAGAISWAQNCNASVSYHYVVRSSDGQITQMVHEADKAWHVGSENPYTIGIEHEGYVSDPSWYTEALYQHSALLCQDIVNSGYGIPPFRTYYGTATSALNTLGSCTKIKGHQHFPNQTHTDPGLHWNWEKYYQLINDQFTIQTLTNSTGILYDSGGPANDYTDDERLFWLIEPTGADSLQLEFSSFALESDYDFLFIYNGASINAPLIGKFTSSNSPGTIVSSGNALLLEFRSDCGVQDAGWEANYVSFSGQTTDISVSEGGMNVQTNLTANWLFVQGISSPSELVLFASDGRKVGSWNCDKDLLINLSSYSDGFYLLTLNNRKTAVVKRLFISH